jgi:hypothetical protein
LAWNAVEILASNVGIVLDRSLTLLFQ